MRRPAQVVCTSCAMALLQHSSLHTTAGSGCVHSSCSSSFHTNSSGRLSAVLGWGAACCCARCLLCIGLPAAFQSAQGRYWWALTCDSSSKQQHDQWQQQQHREPATNKSRIDSSIAVHNQRCRRGSHLFLAQQWPGCSDLSVGCSLGAVQRHETDCENQAVDPKTG